MCSHLNAHLRGSYGERISIWQRLRKLDRSADETSWDDSLTSIRDFCHKTYRPDDAIITALVCDCTTFPVGGSPDGIMKIADHHRVKHVCLDGGNVEICVCMTRLSPLVKCTVCGWCLFARQIPIPHTKQQSVCLSKLIIWWRFEKCFHFGHRGIPQSSRSNIRIDADCDNNKKAEKVVQSLSNRQCTWFVNCFRS
jgi:hypothetical protein